MVAVTITIILGLILAGVNTPNLKVSGAGRMAGSSTFSRGRQWKQRRRRGFRAQCATRCAYARYRAAHGRNRGYDAGFSASWPSPRFSGVLLDGWQRGQKCVPLWPTVIRTMVSAQRGHA